MLFSLLAIDFPEDLAWRYLLKLTSFGPRYPGTQGHRLAKEYIIQELSRYTHPDTQVFFIDKIEFTNIYATFGKGKLKYVIGTHWDTVKDVGANNGASGVAVLLALADVLAKENLKEKIILVFFDGEDYGELINGSQEFVRRMKEKPEGVVIIDMVGDKNLEIYAEGFSLAFAREFTEEIFKLAEELGLPSFHREKKYTIKDDHLPFLRAGIPACLLIDFDYPYWKTPQDTPDKCSKESLGEVGKLLLELIRRN